MTSFTLRGSGNEKNQGFSLGWAKATEAASCGHQKKRRADDHGHRKKEREREEGRKVPLVSFPVVTNVVMNNNTCCCVHIGRGNRRGRKATRGEKEGLLAANATM